MGSIVIIGGGIIGVIALGVIALVVLEYRANR